MLLRFDLPADAELSPCNSYRWWLTRRWDGTAGTPFQGRAVGFVMLNPSTADARADDPTIRRCIGFAQRWGYQGLAVANLYGWRTSDPAALLRAKRRGDDIVGQPFADRALIALVDAVGLCGLIITAWGAHPLTAQQAPQVLALLRGVGGPRGVQLRHLGRTEDGSPKHPLARGRQRIPDDIVPMEWT